MLRSGGREGCSIGSRKGGRGNVVRMVGVVNLVLAAAMVTSMFVPCEGGASAYTLLEEIREEIDHGGVVIEVDVA